MSELLLHLIEVEPPKDPVIAAQVEIAQHKLRYADAALSRDEQIAAYESALERTRQLIRDQADHPQRPIWQTDLAEMLLIEYLGAVHQNAAMFYEFGVPSAEQKAAFERAAVEALEAVESASLRFFQLQGSLPREPDHVELRVNTGLWDRMIGEYYEKRTAFYLAHAAHDVTLLPQDHPYWSESNVNVPDKEVGYAKERTRLGDVVQQSVSRFVADRADAAGVRVASTAVLGRNQLALGKLDDALTNLDAAATAKSGDVYELSAHLGIAQLHAARKQFNEAVDKLAALDEFPLIQSNLLYRLLLVDAQHRVLLQQAQAAPATQRDAAIAAAYEPYLELLADESLGEQAASLQNYIYTRWASTPGGAGGAGGDVSKLPPVVRMAIGEMARAEGQNAVLDAEQSSDAAKRAEGVAKLERAIAVSEPLTAEGVDAPIRARAMYNVALATYFRDQQELMNILKASALLVRLAEEMPDQPQAEEAIAGAVGLLRALHQVEPKPAGADEAYGKAVAVLFEKFPTSEAADNERLYYAYYVLVRAGRYDEAVDVLLRVPPTHPDYLKAQREALLAVEQAMLAATGPAKEPAIARVREQAAMVQSEAEAQPTNPDADAALAAVKLSLAAAAMAEGKVDDAIAQLEGFEARFSEQPDFVRLALERRIIALAEAGRLQQLETTAKAMTDAYPQESAAVIDQVLTRLDERIGALRVEAASTTSQIRKGELEKQATDLASTASMLSRLLVKWATDQGYTPEQMLPYELIQSESLRLAGQPQEAVAITTRLASAFPQDADVLTHHADALFALGTDEALVQAATFYDRVISGLQPPYPDAWWNAWLKRLQIIDQLGGAVGDIPLRVRQLQATDPNLGGPRFKSSFERLMEKHSR